MRNAFDRSCLFAVALIVALVPGLMAQTKQWPSGPVTSFAAVGNSGNIVWIDPDHDIVLVWRWAGAGGAMDGMVARIVASVSGD
jgi:hypothetical protein